MAHLIITAGHRIMFRAPYYPVDGPIEYVFNTIQDMLRVNNALISDGPSFVNLVQDCIGNIPLFVPYFENCGYWR